MIVNTVDLGQGVIAPYVEFEGQHQNIKGVAMITEKDSEEVLDLWVGPHAHAIAFKNNVSLCKKIN